MIHELKATELRIGNWISYRGEKDLVVVSIQSPYGSVHTERYIGSGIYVGSDDLMDYQPIEITEDVLLNCGFIRTNPTWFKKSCIGFDLNINLEGEIFLDDSNLDYFDLPVKYLHLHKLQNIYYILTGEDLIYNKEHNV